MNEASDKAKPDPAMSATGTKQKSHKPSGFRIASDPVATPAADSQADNGVAHKYDVGAKEPEPQQSAQAEAVEDLGELPSGYGLNRIYLVAKDPQWLFTYWDVDWAAHASLIRNGQVFLRLLDIGGVEVDRVVINPYAHNWYLPAPKSGASYTAELGYENESGAWTLICRSSVTEVPASELQPEGEAVFARLPMHLAFEQLLDAVKSAMQSGESLVEALSRLQTEGALEPGGIKPAEWSPERRRIFEALLGKEVIERISLGSGMLDEALRRQIAESLSSLPSSELSARLSQLAESGPTSLSSGFGASWSAQPFSQRAERSFFLHVNAEVIFYGGTDPDATVWIDGRKIQLQPDGTFSYHFKFPDGRSEVPIVAESPDGVERRSATLSFQRQTVRKGDVGHTAQPPHLDSISDHHGR